jgi:hypothetical protein
MNEELVFNILRNVCRTDNQAIRDAFDNFIIHALIIDPGFAVTAESIHRQEQIDREAAITAAVESVLVKNNIDVPNSYEMDRI